MNNYIIKCVSKYTEHYLDNWSVGYEGSEAVSATLATLDKILEPHEKVLSVEKVDKDVFDNYFKR